MSPAANIAEMSAPVKAMAEPATEAVVAGRVVGTVVAPETEPLVVDPLVVDPLVVDPLVVGTSVKGSHGLGADWW
jgi:hypothetical protein